MHRLDALAAVAALASAGEHGCPLARTVKAVHDDVALFGREGQSSAQMKVRSEHAAGHRPAWPGHAQPARLPQNPTFRGARSPSVHELAPTYTDYGSSLYSAGLHVPEFVRPQLEGPLTTSLLRSPPHSYGPHRAVQGVQPPAHFRRGNGVPEGATAALAPALSCGPLHAGGPTRSVSDGFDGYTAHAAWAAGMRSGSSQATGRNPTASPPLHAPAALQANRKSSPGAGRNARHPPSPARPAAPFMAGGDSAGGADWTRVPGAGAAAHVAAAAVGGVAAAVDAAAASGRGVSGEEDNPAACLALMGMSPSKGGPGPLQKMRIAQSLLTQRERLGLGAEQVAAVLQHLSVLCQRASVTDLAAALAAQQTQGQGPVAQAQPQGPAAAQQKPAPPVPSGKAASDLVRPEGGVSVAAQKAGELERRAGDTAYHDAANGAAAETAAETAERDTPPGACASGWDWGLAHCSSMERNNAAGGLETNGSAHLATTTLETLEPPKPPQAVPTDEPQLPALLSEQHVVAQIPQPQAQQEKERLQQDKQQPEEQPRRATRRREDAQGDGALERAKQRRRTEREGQQPQAPPQQPAGADAWQPAAAGAAWPRSGCAAWHPACQPWLLGLSPGWTGPHEPWTWPVGGAASLPPAMCGRTGAVDGARAPGCVAEAGGGSAACSAHVPQPALTRGARVQLRRP